MDNFYSICKNYKYIISFVNMCLTFDFTYIILKKINFGGITYDKVNWKNHHIC